MDFFASPAALERTRRNAFRGVFSSWFLILLFLAALVLGCKKSAPTSANVPTSSSTSTTNAPAAGLDTGAAKPGGGGVTANGADQPGSLADRLKAVQEGPPPDPAKQIHLPSWKPVSSATSTMQIPLIEGLAMNGTLSGNRYGDLESTKTIQNVNAKSYDMVLSGDIITKLPAPGTTTGLVTKHVSGTRTIDMADLANAHHFMDEFQINKTEHFPGSTANTFSSDVVNQLRAGKTVDFDYSFDPQSMLADTFSGHATMSEAIMYWGPHMMYKCPLTRVEPTDLSLPVLVNDIRVELPAIHAKCDLTGEDQSHFYILDEPSNPILLASQVAGTEDRSQVIRITWPLTPSGAGVKSPMEASLADKKPVEIYGIYFDFNSSEIKPESEAVLKQIAGILQRNPDWKLNVSGHTDNVGDSAFNLGLSQRRAAAVKDALVSRYKIAPGRLATGGYGASRPIEPNTTLEGRARNRRVELQRQ